MLPHCFGKRRETAEVTYIKLKRPFFVVVVGIFVGASSRCFSSSAMRFWTFQKQRESTESATPLCLAPV